MTWVKICGLVREEDARLAADWGANALGFVLAKSPRQADWQILAAWLPQFTTTAWKVGVFLDPAAEELWQIVDACGLTAIQLHGHEEPDWCRRLNQQIPVIKRVRNPREADRYRAVATHLLWEPYPAEAAGSPDIWAGGLTPGNLPQVLAQAPWGVNVARGVEQAPGVKDHARLRRFLELAKQDLIQA